MITQVCFSQNPKYFNRAFPGGKKKKKTDNKTLLFSNESEKPVISDSFSSLGGIWVGFCFPLKNTLHLCSRLVSDLSPYVLSNMQQKHLLGIVFWNLHSGENTEFQR